MSQAGYMSQRPAAALHWQEGVAADGGQSGLAPTRYRRINKLPLFGPGWRLGLGDVAAANRSAPTLLTEREADRLPVQRCQRGEQQAFDLLVAKYQCRLLRSVSKIIYNRSDAQDTVQEAFMRAYRALPTFRHESAFYTWLFQIATNASRNFLRKQKLIGNLSVAPPGGDNRHADDHDGIDNRTPPTALENKQTLVVLNRVLDTLPESLAGALLLHELEGLSYEEIARMQGCPIGTVRSRIYRAREMIAVKIAALEPAATKDKEQEP